MTYVGIDLEQFVRDPYGSGIQRVLQYLALEWPGEVVSADFVVPDGDRFAILSTAQAATVLSVPFAPRDQGADLRDLVSQEIARMAAPRVAPGDLMAIYDSWLLPEVSYLPSVLDRFARMTRCMTTTMIGYDTLPMSEPANYRFRPGAAGAVSEYFRLLARADRVVCISSYARASILTRLRRDPLLPISVAHPGGDHITARGDIAARGDIDARLDRSGDRVTFCRLGTLEARKRPVEILRAFESAISAGAQADLVFVGGPSASDESINDAVRAAQSAGLPVRWITDASDAQVQDIVTHADAFLSIGVEGYGIPVLEAIRLGTPVLFDGVQPAGDLMVGHGARRVPALEPADLVALFTTYSAAGALDDLVRSVDPRAVPTWAGFARSVAAACLPTDS